MFVSDVLWWIPRVISGHLLQEKVFTVSPLRMNSPSMMIQMEVLLIRREIRWNYLDGTILAGTDNGILFIKDGKIISTLNDKDDLTNSKILSAMELPDGKVYACTDGGGIAVISNRKVERMLTVTDGLSSNVILRTIYNQEGKGVFIVASNGLQYMNEKGEINTLSNFPYYNNYDIVLRGEKAFVEWCRHLCY